MGGGFLSIVQGMPKNNAPQNRVEETATCPQTHISGKKHKTKLAMKNVWPVSIFTLHPYVQNEKGKGAADAMESTLQKMAEEVHLHNKGVPELDKKYSKYRGVTTHIEQTLGDVKWVQFFNIRYWM